MPQELQLPPPPSRKFRSYILTTLVVIIVLTLILPCVWLFSGRVSSDTATITTHLTPVNALMSNSIVEILVQPGALVQEGQVLARMDGTVYANADAAARALVRGTGSHIANSPQKTQSTEARVQAAQEAEERMVHQVALARHEEASQRALVEQRSAEHAAALIRMRSLNVGTTPPPANARQEAQKAEQQALQNLNAAQDAFSLASRSRAAIEGELRNIRNEVAAGYTSMPPGHRNSMGRGAKQGKASQNFDPTVFKAPFAGRLVGLFPALEQKVSKGQTVFQLMPEGQVSIWATAVFDAEAAKDIEQGQICFVLPMHSIGEAIYGTVKNVSAPISGEADSATSVIVTVALEPTELSDNIATLIQTRAQVVVWQHTIWGMETLRPVLQLLSHI